MKKVTTFLLSIFVALLFVLPSQAQNKSAKKIYREYKKKDGFKEAQIPSFLIGAARLIVKDANANTIMKAIQKAKVISRIDKPSAKYNTSYFENINSNFSNAVYKLVPSKNGNMQIRTKEKNGKIKEMAIATKTGPSLHYVVIKGKMKKDEADKFVSQLSGLGINVEKVKDQLLDQLGDLLEQFDGQ